MTESKIPQQVSALKVHKFGTMPVLEAEKLPSKLGDTDIIVKIEATGITHFDLFLMSGKIPLPMNFPYIPGTDCVGRVTFVLFRWSLLEKLLNLFWEKESY